MWHWLTKKMYFWRWGLCPAVGWCLVLRAPKLWLICMRLVIPEGIPVGRMGLEMHTATWSGLVALRLEIEWPRKSHTVESNGAESSPKWTNLAGDAFLCFSMWQPPQNEPFYIQKFFALHNHHFGWCCVALEILRDWTRRKSNVCKITQAVWKEAAWGGLVSLKGHCSESVEVIFVAALCHNTTDKPIQP